MPFVTTDAQRYIQEPFRTGNPLLGWIHQLAIDAANVRSAA
ncbi:hypothetical protein SIM91_05905 [Rhodococcus opacus]|nr:hypothetical protein [Rhodococcus opacus]MDX5962849.1 hypothetical protein [Rhodococcus opacus]CAG7637236.1 hypothetical protein E143388_07873 [Rhodococcus opacus]